MSDLRYKVAVVDYDMGNVLNVCRACHAAGLGAFVTSDRRRIENADAVILPGVGAFGDAMNNLQSLGLIDPLRQYAQSQKPLIGICLGMQLLMTSSAEFGEHSGLDIIGGKVVHFDNPKDDSGELLKVPQVGWNHIYQSDVDGTWKNTFLEGLCEAEYMYFVHSYYVRPDDPSVIVADSSYGDIRFCSALRKDNIFACQFHPEKSGPAGLVIYRNLKKHIQSVMEVRC